MYRVAAFFRSSNNELGILCHSLSSCKNLVVCINKDPVRNVVADGTYMVYVNLVTGIINSVKLDIDKQSIIFIHIYDDK